MIPFLFSFQQLVSFILFTKSVFLTVCIPNNIGRRWIKQMFIGAFLIPAMVCGTAFFINFIAIYYHASRAIPFGTMVGLTQNVKCNENYIDHNVFLFCF